MKEFGEGDLDKMSESNAAELKRLRGIHGENISHNEMREIDNDYHQRMLKYNELFQADSTFFNPDNFPEELKLWEK